MKIQIKKHEYIPEIDKFRIVNYNSEKLKKIPIVSNTFKNIEHDPLAISISDLIGYAEYNSNKNEYILDLTPFGEHLIKYIGEVFMYKHFRIGLKILCLTTAIDYKNIDIDSSNIKVLYGVLYEI